jgi:hypothetical protein
MQGLSGVTAAQFKASVQAPKAKLEIYYGGGWVDLTNLAGKNYLKSWSISLGGAAMTPTPVAGTWSAAIDNPDGIFYPANTAGAYYDYFTTGRKVRISVGGTYGGVDVYWQRIIGFMDSPKFAAQIGGDVQLSGMDYNQYLADFKLKSPSNYWGTSVTKSTAINAAVERCVNGGFDANTNSWIAGDATLASVAGGVAGNCLQIMRTGGGSQFAYQQMTALLTIGRTYTVSVYVKSGSGIELVLNGGFSSATTSWTGGDCTLASVAGGQSGNCLQITRTGGGSQYAAQTITGLIVGRTYIFSAYVKSGTSGDEAMEINVYNAAGTGTPLASRAGTSTAAWVKHSIVWVATETGCQFALKKITSTAGTMLFDEASAIEAEVNGPFQICVYNGAGTGTPLAMIIGETTDSWTQYSMKFVATETGAQFALKKVDSRPVTILFDTASFYEEQTGVYRYAMPADCKGIYYVTWNTSPIYSGTDWLYDAVTNEFVFNADKTITAGVNNLILYYFQTQVPENVVADILVSAGLYATRAAALAAGTFTATGITIDRVSFPGGNSALYSIGQICERCNYRFFFKYDGTPAFIPAPAIKGGGLEDFALEQNHIAGPSYYEDTSELWNFIDIVGEEKAQPIGLEQTEKSNYKGSASNSASITADGEHTKSISNHLFQSDAICAAMATTLLALYKDKKKYMSVRTEFFAVPLEKGDTIRAQVRLAPADGKGKKWGTFKWSDGTKWGGNGTVLVHRGKIRDIKIDNFSATYVLELAP